MQKFKKVLLTMFVLLCCLSLCACGGGGDQPASGGQEAQSGETQQRLVRVGMADEWYNYDPFDNVLNPDNRVRSQIYDYLLEMDAEGQVSGLLAESFETSADGLTHTFHIREGVKFTNGTDLTGEDVKFSIETAAASASNSIAFANMESCELLDPYTLVVHMSSADAAFLQKLTDKYCCIVSKAAYEEFGEEYGKSIETTVGSGPYILTDWTYGERCSMKANPDYWRGAPSIEQIEIEVIYDNQTAMVALQTGEIDIFIYDVPYAYVETMKQADNLTLIEYPSYTWYFTLMNNESGPFADVRMRQAVAYAIDRDKAMQVAVEGLGEIADSPGGSVTTANPGNKDWYQMNVAKAQELVKECGMEGATIDFIYFPLEPFPKIATSIVEDLTNIGLNINVVSMDSSVWDESVWYGGDGNWQITLMRWFYTTNDMSEAMNMNLLSTGNGNLSLYSNPEMDQLLLEGMAGVELQDRIEAYSQAIDIMNAEAPFVPLFYAGSSRAFANDLTCDPGLVRYDRIYNYHWAN